MCALFSCILYVDLPANISGCRLNIPAPPSHLSLPAPPSLPHPAQAAPTHTHTPVPHLSHLSLACLVLPFLIPPTTADRSRTCLTCTTPACFACPSPVAPVPHLFHRFTCPSPGRPLVPPPINRTTSLSPVPRLSHLSLTFPHLSHQDLSLTHLPRTPPPSLP